MSIPNNPYDEVADRAWKKSFLLFQAFIPAEKMPDVERIMTCAIIDSLKEMNDCPLAEIATARSLAERDGKGWLFKAGDAHKMNDAANILRQNYLSDAKHLIERIKRHLGK